MRLFTSLLLAAAFIPTTFASALAQDPPSAVIKAEASQASGDEAQIDVAIENAQNVGAFEFILVFDAELLEVARVERGEFIGASGREVYCLDPVIDAGALRYECVTLGDTPETGSGGAGLLATVFLTSKNDGKTSVELTRARITTPMGEQMPVELVGDSLEVFGGGDGFPVLTMALIVGGAVLVVGALSLVMIRLRNRTPAPLSGSEST